ncbi:MAG: hypothetical protein ABSF71_17600, partial [Terriglobia bacterium]
MKGIIKGMLFLTAVAVSVSLVADAQGEKTVGQWEPFEVTMTANAAFADAYVEAMPDDGTPYVQVTFTGTGGDALAARGGNVPFRGGEQSVGGRLRQRAGRFERFGRVGIIFPG